jgi:cytolysin-activating lysine-acyltransferase
MSENNETATKEAEPPEESAPGSGPAEAAGSAAASESEGEMTGEQAGDAPKKTVATALGEMCWLLSQSPTHRHALFCADLEWLVMPPLMQGQYRLFYGEGRPVGVALWAFVSETVEQRLAGGGRIGSEDWRSGDRVWLVEIVAPFGNQDRMLDDLCNTALADRKFRFIRTHPNGRRETVEQTGVHVP